MKLSSPKKLTWWIAVVLGVLGILLHLGAFAIAGLSGYGFWLVAVAFVLLVLATFIKGL